MGRFSHKTCTSFCICDRTFVASRKLASDVFFNQATFHKQAQQDFRGTKDLQAFLPNSVGKIV